MNQLRGGGITNNNSFLTTNQDSQNISKNSELYGKWIYVDNGKPFYYYSNSDLKVQKVDNNLIKVIEPDGSDEYAMRAGSSKVTVIGKIDFLTHKRDNIGSVKIVLENISDNSIQKISQIDKNGNFKITNIPSGEYKIKIDKIEDKISITKQIENIGTYTLRTNTDYTFKVSLKLNDKFIYADDKNYTGEVIVKNLTDNIAKGISYEINISSKYLKNFSRDIVLGSIPGYSQKSIPIEFSFHEINHTLQIPINVRIKDIYGNEWFETPNFTLYKDKFYINFESKSSNIKGYLTLPFSNEVIKIDAKTGILILPVIDKNYQLLLFNPSFEDESIYAIGINKKAQIDEYFNNLAIYEPNDKIEQASIIKNGDMINSYMHFGDLDYFKIESKISEKKANSFISDEENQGIDFKNNEDNNFIEEIDNNVSNDKVKENNISISDEENITSNIQISDDSNISSKNLNLGYDEITKNGIYEGDKNYYLKVLKDAYFAFTNFVDTEKIDIYNLDSLELTRIKYDKFKKIKRVFLKKGEYKIYSKGDYFQIFSPLFLKNINDLIKIERNKEYNSNVFYHLEINSSKTIWFDLSYTTTSLQIFTPELSFISAHDYTDESIFFEKGEYIIVENNSRWINPTFVADWRENIVRNTIEVTKKDENLSIDLSQIDIIKCSDLEVGDIFYINNEKYEVVDDENIKDRDDYIHICTSKVTNMSYLFKDNKLFNQNISKWDVSNVRDMSCMFYNAKSFNQPLNKWDTSNVRDMSKMFKYAKSFNQPLRDWNVSNVRDMSYMFSYANKFNQALNDWDVSNVEYMNNMFEATSSLKEQYFKDWNVSNVINHDFFLYESYSGAYRVYPNWR